MRRQDDGGCGMVGRHTALPSLLPSKSLVEQGKNLGNIELNVFQVQFVLVVLLHLEQVVELEVEFQQPPISAFAHC